MLSYYLRIETAKLHCKAEALLGLPAAIQGRDSYIKILSHFHGLYAPLEQVLREHHGWCDLDLDLEQRGNAGRLTRDLAALGTRPTFDRRPDFHGLTSFPHALGALYVQEGSTLGGQIVLRHLNECAIGIPADAMAFFGGHGVQTATMWRCLTKTLDLFGEQHGEAQGAVLEGARLTFQAVIAWFEQARHQGNPT
jgi:heme oxygenase